MMSSLRSRAVATCLPISPSCDTCSTSLRSATLAAANNRLHPVQGQTPVFLTVITDSVAAWRQVHASAQGLRLITFDADGTLYADGAHMAHDNEMISHILALMRSGVGCSPCPLWLFEKF